MIEKCKDWCVKFEKWTPLIARVLVAAVFLYLGWLKINQFGNFVVSLSALPFLPASAWAIITIAIEVGCGVLVLFGYKTRLAASILITFSIIVAIMILLISKPNFAILWAQVIVPNLGMIAALMLVAKHGSDIYSLDKKFAGQATTPQL